MNDVQADRFAWRMAHEPWYSCFWELGLLSACSSGSARSSCYRVRTAFTVNNIRGYCE